MRSESDQHFHRDLSAAEYPYPEAHSRSASTAVENEARPFHIELFCPCDFSLISPIFSVVSRSL